MLPHILLLLAVVIWGWTFVATKIVVGEIGPVELLSLRLVIGVPFLGALLVARRVPLHLERDDLRPVLLGGALITTHFLVQITGLQTTTATNTAWIITVTPLVLALLSVLLLRERVGRGGIAGIAIASVGILLLVSRGRLADLDWLRSTGDWLALASAFTWAFYTVATRALVGRRDPLLVTFAILSVAAVMVLPLFAVVGDVGAVRALSPRALWALLYLAIPGLALGHWFWQEGVAELGGTRSGFYLYLEPLSTVALAVPLLGEPFGPVAALGGALVLTGVFVGQRQSRPTASGSALAPEEARG
jgi:drug/metabolite transporter (DMT)-like permease